MVTKHDLVVASTQHHSVSRDHRARLVSSNRESFAHYTYISYFFNKYSLYLYVYTEGILRCPLGSCGGNNNLILSITETFLTAGNLNYSRPRPTVGHVGLQLKRTYVTEQLLSCKCSISLTSARNDSVPDMSDTPIMAPP